VTSQHPARSFPELREGATNSSESSYLLRGSSNISRIFISISIDEHTEDPFPGRVTPTDLSEFCLLPESAGYAMDRLCQLPGTCYRILQQSCRCAKNCQYSGSGYFYSRGCRHLHLPRSCNSYLEAFQLDLALQLNACLRMVRLVHSVL
jgi:hypothetical protein